MTKSILTHKRETKMTSEIEKLLIKLKADTLGEVEGAVLLEMLVLERRAIFRLREQLKSATYELDDACALHEIGVCHKKQDAVIRLIIGDTTTHYDR